MYIVTNIFSSPKCGRKEKKYEKILLFCDFYHWNFFLLVAGNLARTVIPEILPGDEFHGT